MLWEWGERLGSEQSEHSYMRGGGHSKTCLKRRLGPKQILIDCSLIPLIQLPSSSRPLAHCPPEVVGTPIHTKLFIAHWEWAGSELEWAGRLERAGSSPCSLSLPSCSLLLLSLPLAPLTPSCSLSLLLLLACPLPHRGGRDPKTYYNILMVIGSEREQAGSKGSELGAF